MLVNMSQLEEIKFFIREALHKLNEESKVNKKRTKKEEGRIEGKAIAYREISDMILQVEQYLSENT